jgi:hypothetical protein
VKFKSALVTAISGSIGGMTGAHNKGGMYLRARATPTNPASAFQVAVRNAMAQLVVFWGDGLTQTQRDAWDLYAFNTPVNNALGDSVQRSGQQMFLRGNVTRLKNALDIVSDGPANYNLGEFTAPTFAVDETNQEVDVTFDDTDTWAGETGSAMVISVSRPQSVGVNFFKGPYRQAGLIAGDDTTPPTSPAAIALPFPVAVGQKVFFEARVSRVDGRLSSPFRGSVTVA